MGNLGAYQAITTAAKAVGGPEKLVVLIAGAGYAIGRGVEAGCKKAVPFVRRKLGFETEKSIATYSVANEFTDEQGLTLHVGDDVRILEADGDAILIEILGGNDNPHFVSLEDLQTAIGDDLEI